MIITLFMTSEFMTSEKKPFQLGIVSQEGEIVPVGKRASPVGDEVTQIAGYINPLLGDMPHEDDGVGVGHIVDGIGDEELGQLIRYNTSLLRDLKKILNKDITGLTNIEIGECLRFF